MPGAVTVTRAYYKYWKALKDARYDPHKVAKIVTCKLPESLVRRFIKAVRKEKDMDWEFKAENMHDPYRLHNKIEVLEQKPLGRSICLVTLWIERASDL